MIFHSFSSSLSMFLYFIICYKSKKIILKNASFSPCIGKRCKRTIHRQTLMSLLQKAQGLSPLLGTNNSRYKIEILEREREREDKRISNLPLSLKCIFFFFFGNSKFEVRFYNEWRLDLRNVILHLVIDNKGKKPFFLHLSV